MTYDDEIDTRRAEYDRATVAAIAGGRTAAELDAMLDALDAERATRGRYTHRTPDALAPNDGATPDDARPEDDAAGFLGWDLFI